ncbi:helix-turn-helix domain-containing protein [Microbulbifer sp. HZ11]|uniref:helix-turn-helix domain-containing protein n=1 Tax=Microbulbifer sp. HZ11 TaxID=1453501 RepID=UPI0005B766F0|nr:helix-turn-helix transcriptional regulator [Microbulbifer sp. HZ11]
MPGKIGQRLRAARRRQGLSATEAGKRVGNLSRSQISKMESGVQRIPSDLLPRWCEAVGISLAEAYGKEHAHHFARVPFAPHIAKLYAQLPTDWQLHVQRSIEGLHKLYAKTKNRS